MLQSHHIVGDATSLELAIAEMVAHLQRRETHEHASPPYRSHVAQMLAQGRTRDSEAFFRDKLADVDEPTAVFDMLTVDGDEGIAEARDQLDAELSRRVRTQARCLVVSPATLFHAAWALVLARCSGRGDVVFGTVLLGRLHGITSLERALGMFINTLPLRLWLDGITVKELVQQTQRELIHLLNHEQASLAVAQRCSGVPASMPLFSTLLNYRHRSRVPEAEWTGADGIALVARCGFTTYPDDAKPGSAANDRIHPNRAAGSS
jgi:hypothetical protein